MEIKADTNCPKSNKKKVKIDQFEILNSNFTELLIVKISVKQQKISNGQ